MSITTNPLVSRVWLTGSVLAATTLAVAWVLAGARGPLYLGLLAAAAGGGLPWGFALFGRGHAAGWLAGALFGYAMAGLTWWASTVAASAAPGWCLAVWVLLVAASWRLTRCARRAPLAPLPAWSQAASAALLVVLLLVPVLVGRPFARIGSPGDDGSRRYAAYFTADFVWHMALVEELARRANPPIDPYFAGEPLHYYWTYFLVPAALTGVPPGFSAAEALALNALACGLLFVAAIYLGAWVVVPERPWTAALAVALVVSCGSVEGVAGLAGLQWVGEPLSRVRDVNIDALAAWVFRGLRVDNLPRAMWYTPQHAMAFAMGMVASLVAVGGGRVAAGRVLLAGTALGLSTTFNPFVGLACSAVYAVGAAVSAWEARAPRRLIAHAPVLLPIAGAMAWCYWNQITVGAAGAIHLGWWGPATHAPGATFLMSFFPALLPAVLGAWAGRRFWPSAATPALAGVLLSVIAMYTVTLRADPHWVGFRSGHLLFGWLPPLVAVGYERLREAGRDQLARVITATVLLLGLPTTVIDAYRAQDVENRDMGPGFHWTTTLTPAMLDGFAWIRAHTPATAVVQAEPVVRGRDTWSLIPSFAGRRMAAGLPISLLHVPAYDTRSAMVRRIFSTGDARDAHRLARWLGIDYLYVDATDRRAYPATVKFDREPDYFTPVFSNGDVGIYAVR